MRKPVERYMSKICENMPVEPRQGEKSEEDEYWNWTADFQYGCFVLSWAFANQM